MDQCMLRPEQTEHGSFALKFEREYPLICNDGQLFGENTRNGTLPSIPYRLKSTIKNEVTKQCEIKRQEYCKINEGKEKCSRGAETLWHGIFIKTQIIDEENTINMTLSLSITKNETFVEGKIKKK
uniref:Phlebovirus glycoprotein G2 fusion domain-containing protein n=1 Tax=Meloidogyne hapla TaxID=6305 RepID=A0A1I8B501_MELHA